MKSRKGSTTVSKEIEIDLGNGEYDYINVEFEINASFGNHGIGQYEYWGTICYDNQWGWEIDEITWKEELYTPEQNKIIEAYCENNDNFDDAFQNFD